MLYKHRTIFQLQKSTYIWRNKAVKKSEYLKKFFSPPPQLRDVGAIFVEWRYASHKAKVMTDDSEIISTGTGLEIKIYDISQTHKKYSF